MTEKDITILCAQAIDTYIRLTSVERWAISRFKEDINENSSIYNHEKASVIRAAMETEEGRAALAQSYVEPYIREHGGVNSDRTQYLNLTGNLGL